MSNAPWQAVNACDEIIVLLDVAHAVEQHELERFLDASLRDHGISARIHHVVLPLRREPENLPTSSLRPLMGHDENCFVMPLRVVWRTSLEEKTIRPRPRDLLFGNPRRPGPSRARRILRQHPERAVCIAGQPASLKDLRERMESRRGEPGDDDALAVFVAGQAALALDVAERRLRGSRYKVPRRVAQNLLASAKFRSALQEVADNTGRSIPDLTAESEDIMKELIAIPQPFWLDVMAQLNHQIMSLGYKADVVVDRESLERVRQLTREFPTALLWTHKTHVDGFAVNSVCFDNDFPAPHILGGVNMAFAGLGYVARRAGGIFIRRSFQDNLLYKMILRQYIGYLMDKRFPLSWSFEGTRSRVGKLMPPRYGLLKYVMDSAHNTGAENLHFVPVSISYDLIGDVKDYAKEQAGGVKRPESLSWFIGYLRGLRQPMGKIYFNFGEPVILETVPSPEDPRELQRVAFAVGVEANRVTPITVPSLLSMILLGSAPRALTAEELERETNIRTEWAIKRGIRLTDNMAKGDEMEVLELIDDMVANGLLTRYDDGPELVYTIAAEQHGVASYYRNTISHYFVAKAIAELSLVYMARGNRTGAEQFWSEAERLRDLFKFEFFYAPREQFRRDIEEELSRYQPRWEAALDEEGFALSLFTRLVPLVSHAVLLPFVEAYRVVADVIARHTGDEVLTEKECVQKALAYGRQAYLQRRISSEASIGKVYFGNGYKLAENFGLLEGNAAELEERRLELAQSFRSLQRRLEQVRAAALPN